MLTAHLDPFQPETELVPTSQLDYEFGGDYHFEYNYQTYWKTITEFCHLVSSHRALPLHSLMEFRLPMGAA